MPKDAVQTGASVGRGTPHGSQEAASFAENNNSLLEMQYEDLKPTLDEARTLAGELLAGPFHNGNDFANARAKLEHGQPGVYLVRRRKGKFLYVGMSRRLRARLGQYVPIGRGLGGGQFRILLAKKVDLPMRGEKLTAWMSKNLEWSFRTASSADVANMVEMLLVCHLRHKQLYNKS